MAEQQCTVVIVDDAADVRLLIRAQLARSAPFSVVGEGRDGIEAIELAREHRPDILLLDVSMPRMDGLEALPLIRAAAPSTRVVIYTGFAEGGLEHQALQAGAAAVVAKSTSLEDLVDRLQAIRTGQPQSAAGGDQPRTASADVATVLDDHLERFREVFEQAAIGMATMTLTGRIVRANEALGALLRRGAGELVGQPYAAFVDQRAAEKLAELLPGIAVGPHRSAQLEHEIPGDEGPSRLLATFAPVRDAVGRALYLFLQVRDVTMQRRAEEDLRRSEERFRLLVEAVQDYAIFMLDPGGHIASWNAGAQRIKGYAAEEIIGKHFRTFYPPAVQASGHPEHELEIALREGHYEEEGWRVRKDGSLFWASVVITAIRTPSGEHVGFTKVTRDVEERRRMLLDLEHAAAALAEANADLEAANAQLARDAAAQADFLATTAHELRTPVTVLGGSASLLSRHWGDMTDDERGELFASIGATTSRLQRLLADLLTIARLDTDTIRLHTQEVDVPKLLARSAASARAAHGGADIRVDAQPGLAVAGEPDRLAQAVDNLLDNALRHGSPPVQLRAYRADGRVEIAVSDAGAGVAPDLLPRLFQRFATSNRAGGTGLGLYIVRELAAAHGGEVSYAPIEGEPARFVLSLPTHDDG